MNHNNNTNNNSNTGAAVPHIGHWCPPGRIPKQMHGNCYCVADQYSVKPQCLPKQPDCFVEQLGSGYRYYDESHGDYVTYGKNRIES